MIALAYFAALGVILVFSHGMADDAHVLGLCALHVAFVATLFARRKSASWASMSPASRDAALAGVLVVFSLFLAHGHEMLYAQKTDKLALLVDLLHWLPIASAVVLGAIAFEGTTLRPVLIWPALFACLGFLIYARVLVLTVSPRPFIDVWTSSQQAVEYFLDGKNPYGQTYKDIYGGRYDYFPSFPYLPAYLIWATLGMLVFKTAHDVRVSLLFAELFTTVCIVGIARKERFPWTTCALLAVVWLAFPVDLFILEQAWIDSLLLLGFAAATWALASNRLVLCGILLGVACSTKQYAALGVSFFAIFAWRTYGLRGLVKMALAAIVTTALFMVPFAVSNVHQFVKYTLMSWGGALPRTESLSFTAYLARKNPPVGEEALRALYAPYGVIAIVIWLALLVWLGIKRKPTLHDTFLGIAAATGVALLLAKQAFCNYYYFLSFFIFVSMILRSNPAAVRLSARDIS
jgi:hypothetical protein